MTLSPSLVWFRRDLRIADNPALVAAMRVGRPTFAVYILDGFNFFAPGSAQKWFLHHALSGLGADSAKLGVPLILRRGTETETLAAVVQELTVTSVFWNRRYAPDEIVADQQIKGELKQAGVAPASFNGSLLREPWEIETKAGDPFRVFTPFWNALRAAGPSRRETTVPAPRSPGHKQDQDIATDALDDWNLLPKSPDWAAEFKDYWSLGEAGAFENLDAFLSDAVGRYAADRNRPDRPGTSRLSPHLAIGTISPLTVWNRTHAAVAVRSVTESEGLKFLSEIAWREFAYHLLYHNPEMPTAPLRAEFGGFPWRDDAAAFRAWTRGETGVPIVDAGMRELWRTGWMHNRVRMIVASFLVKNLLIPWQKGERWFWNTLIDADPANNTASWQWVAGSGADAAPYFRIFNPVTQGEKFDPDGAYVRKFVPELAALPNNLIHAPWTASPEALRAAGVTLGRDYPHPLVDLGESRARALAAYQEMKGAAA